MWAADSNLLYAHDTGWSGDTCLSVVHTMGTIGLKLKVNEMCCTVAMLHPVPACCPLLLLLLPAVPVVVARCWL